MVSLSLPVLSWALLLHGSLEALGDAFIADLNAAQELKSSTERKEKALESMESIFFLCKSDAALTVPFVFGQSACVFENTARGAFGKG